MTQRPCIFDLTPEQLAALIDSWGMPAYRAEQILQWVYEKGVVSADEMTNIAKAQRRLIADHLRLTAGQVIEHQIASDGVHKLLIDWSDSGAGGSETSTESVLIPTDNRNTVCVSSQIGCAVGCRFCASGLGGLAGNLTAGQIVEQVWRLGQIEGVGRVSNIVFMGMGEPLANFEQVVKAIATLTADWATGISARRITVSTVGLPAQMRRLADLRLAITLAISMHAPDDELRRELIPWADKVSIDQLIEAGRYYFDRTGREVTLEYVLLKAVNDRPEHAKALAQVARQLRSNVNLIRYNPVEGLPYKRPLTEDVQRFQEILRQAGVTCHTRPSRGSEVAAACGQLRRNSA
jgi:23S rRNA (adenine2503-C2)-methyltransferase